MNINTLCSPAAYPGTGASVRITDPQLLARLHAHKHGRLDADDSADDHDDDFDDEQQDHGNDGDVYESGEDDSDEFNEYPMGGNRRLSATMDTSDALFRSNHQWNDGVAVVLDTGSYAVKAGLGCDSFPSVVERSHDSATGTPLVYREQVGTMTTEAVVRVQCRMVVFPEPRLLSPAFWCLPRRSQQTGTL